MEVLGAGFLWGLGLVALPVAIHLLNRRRFVVVRWAPMDFLLQAHRQNRKRIRLEHLLVLLLRCLAIALLVLMVARPVATSGGLAFLPGAGESVERVLVLDDSGSMGFSAGRETRWGRARRVASRTMEPAAFSGPRCAVTLVAPSPRRYVHYIHYT